MTPIAAAAATTTTTSVHPLVAPAIAVAAVLVSLASMYVSLRKYAADQTAPWVQLLLKYIEDELKDLAKDAGLFVQIYTVPFHSLERKKEVVTTLNAVRDESLRRLDALAALTECATELSHKRAKLNKVTDSYFDNNELRLPNGFADRLAADYRDHSRQYAAALQRLARTFCKREGIFPRK